MNILAKQVKCYQCNEKIDDEKFITGRVLKEDKNGKERSYKKNFHDKCAVEFGMQFINKPTETQVKNCHHCGGIVEEIDVEKNCVRVTVSMFGRETPVELELDQAEAVE